METPILTGRELDNYIYARLSMTLRSFADVLGYNANTASRWRKLGVNIDAAIHAENLFDCRVMAWEIRPDRFDEPVRCKAIEIDPRTVVECKAIERKIIGRLRNDQIIKKLGSRS